MPEMDWSRNNLDRAQSRYLQQHAENPVWWQEWSSAALRRAAETARPILVSVGYSTCHWCHVMAREAFSDPEVAELLNEHFLCIKVDREERPDIDKVLMDFLVGTTGSGGWPLNAFLSPQAEPIFAMTYAGLQQRGPVPPFAEILRRVLSHVREDGRTYGPLSAVANAAGAAGEDQDGDPGASAGHSYGAGSQDEVAVLDRYDRALASAVDERFGGFGKGAKFPPHAILIAALHRRDGRARGLPPWIPAAVQAMCYGGLRDYAAGGFFRYTVDREWRIPHFEKMLYDQAGLLWALSLAGAQAASAEEASALLGIAGEVRHFLQTGLRAPGAVLFSSAVNAETGGREGSSYLIARETRLPPPFVPESIPEVDGMFHLVPSFAPEIGLPAREAALHAAKPELRELRANLPEPERDDKQITEWNALAVCALISYARASRNETALAEALSVLEALCAASWHKGGISRLAGHPESGAFLADAAALGLAISFAAEMDPAWLPRLEAIADVIAGFRVDGRLRSSGAGDFVPVPASTFDSPSPSEQSLVAVFGSRLAWQTGNLPPAAPIPRALSNDFVLIAWLRENGFLPSVGLPDSATASDRLAIHPAVLITSAPFAQSCRSGVCTPGISPELRHPATL